MSYLSDLLGNAYKEGMTEEEISLALETINTANTNDHNAEINRLKAAMSKSNSEAADYKKKWKALQSEEEQKRITQQEEFDKLTSENADLKRIIALSEKQTKLVGMGYDVELAKSTAQAMVDGDMDTVMANQTKFIEAQTKSKMAAEMKKSPRPSIGTEGNVSMDYNKKIEEAYNNGNYAEAAYYTRLAQQEQQGE